MEKKQTYSLRGKLVSAICMLMVAIIMVVSSTYAWFTLSTAPEVTGITTAVGANGALEMLLNTGTIYTGTTSDGKSEHEINQMWGNLVDVSNNEYYGMDLITLYPSQLNIGDNGKLPVGGAILKTPSYGADGRVSGLEDNTSTSIYDTTKKAFYAVDGTGIRAVGVASGMTARQLAYRNYAAAAATSASLATIKATQSLNANGGVLANIVAKRAMNESATFTVGELENIMAIINDLNEEDGILDQIENAYAQYIIAYAASAVSGENDAVYTTVQSAWENAAATESQTKIEAFVASLSGLGVTLPGAISTPITELAATRANAKSAQTDLQAKIALAENSYAWTDISEVVGKIANTNAMTLNGYTPAQAKENLSKIVNDIAGGKGVIVDITTDGGVYADIADHCGNYSAKIVIEKLEYGSITLENLNATMNANSTLSPTTYLKAVAAAVDGAGAPAGAAAGEMPITEFYGYIVDLAFKTNAPSSNLLLQTEAADRIYNDNAEGGETWGGGSNMTFQATTDDLSDDQIKELMSYIRIILFDPADGTIYAYAGLDVDNATLGVDGWVANMFLIGDVDYTVNHYTYTGANGDPVTCYELDGTYYSDALCTVVDEAAASATDLTKAVESIAYTYTSDGTTVTCYLKDDIYYTDTTYATEDTNASGATLSASETVYATSDLTRKEFLDGDDAVVSSLVQNEQKNVSVLVYLDGEEITNASVAATGTSSMKGSMNIQFASSANLVPMEYADYHDGGASAETGE